jgi:hypothetical protein
VTWLLARSATSAARGPGSGSADHGRAGGTSAVGAGHFGRLERGVGPGRAGPSRRLRVDLIRLLALDAEPRRRRRRAGAGIGSRDVTPAVVAVVGMWNERLYGRHADRVPGTANVW